MEEVQINIPKKDDCYSYVICDICGGYTYDMNEDTGTEQHRTKKEDRQYDATRWQKVI
jgi:formylmethanofuran dehydrogenase subunit E